MQVRRLFYGVKGALRLAKYASLWEHTMTDEAKRRIVVASDLEALVLVWVGRGGFEPPKP